MRRRGQERCELAEQLGGAGDVESMPATHDHEAAIRHQRRGIGQRGLIDVAVTATTDNESWGGHLAKASPPVRLGLGELPQHSRVERPVERKILICVRLLWWLECSPAARRDRIERDQPAYAVG